VEEFARGVEMLKMQNKNEFDHLQDYVLLANAVNSMTGRANMEIYQRKVKRWRRYFSREMRLQCKPSKPSLLRVFTFSFYRWISSKNFCC
jgi:hypothetical protein